jgi:hypothetical protein
VTKRERARAARAMAKIMRVVGDEEGEGGKAMVIATRMPGKGTVTARKGQWQQQQGWRASNSDGNKEGIGDGNGDDGGGRGRGQWRRRQERWQLQQG